PSKRDNFTLPCPGSKQGSDKRIIESTFLAEVLQDNVPFFPRERVWLRCRKPFPFQVGEMVGQSEARLFRPRVTHHRTESPVNNIPARFQAKAAHLIETGAENVQRR